MSFIARVLTMSRWLTRESTRTASIMQFVRADANKAEFVICYQSIEQDHRAIKRRVNASQGFRSFDGARRTLQGYEAMQMIRKGQVRWLSGKDVVGHVLFVNEIFGVKAA